MSFFRYRAESIRITFQDQIIKQFNPTLYLFTRNLGKLRISPLMSLEEWVERGENIDFSEINKSHSESYSSE